MARTQKTPIPPRRTSSDALTAAWRILSVGGRNYLLAIFAANLAHFGFHLLVSRSLGPSAYGALGAVLGLVLLASVPISAVEISIIDTTARRYPETTPRISRLSLRLGVAAVLLWGLSTLAAPLIAGALHLPNTLPVLAGAALVGLSLLVAVPRGVLLGRLAYTQVGIASAFGAFVKLTAGVVVLANGFALTAALFAAVLAEAVHLLALYLLVSAHQSRPNPTRATTAHPAPESQRPQLVLVPNSTRRFVLATASIWTLASVDVVLARHFFPTVAGGLYVAAGMAAHALLFVPRVAISLVFPILTRLWGADLRRAFSITAGVVTSVVAVAAAVISVLAPSLVAILFGPGYEAAVPLLRVLALAAGATSVIYLVTYLHLAAGVGLTALNWVGVAALLSAVALGLVTSPSQLAWLVAGITFALASVAWTLRRHAWRHSHFPASSVLDGPASTELSVVLPFYNPGPAIASTIADTFAVFDALGISVEVIASDDGSTDNSLSLVSALAASEPRLRLLSTGQNRGKGAAVRSGMVVARGELIAFLDADGEIPPQNLASYVILLRDPQNARAAGVIASKRHADSDVVYPLLRKIWSVGFEMFTKLLFSLGLRDTQTGAKVFRREALAAALPQITEPGFAFDLELLVALSQNGYRDIRTAPVTILENSNSTVSTSTVFDVAFSALRIAARRYLLDGFARSPIQPVLVPSSETEAESASSVGPSFATSAIIGLTPQR